MKQLLSLILILAVIVPAEAQQKKRGKVKRKYRNPERVEIELPPVFLRGKIRDADDNLLPGAHVTVLGTNKSVHANEDGEYFFYGLDQGITRVQVSFVGFKTKSVDFQPEIIISILHWMKTISDWTKFQ